MPHVLIAGMTESGKTTLAKQLCAKYRRSGIETIVLDPLNDPGWQAGFQTTSSDEFNAVVRQSRQCAVFIDESGETIGRYNDDMFWLATRARHYGHNCHFITQRIVQLNKTVRDQCAKLFLFCVSKDDAKALSNGWNNDTLLKANLLKQFECFYCTRFGITEKIQIST